MELNEASFKLKFKDGVARNAARIPRRTWDKHKDLLCSLHQEKTVDEMVALMQAEHGFFVKYVSLLQFGEGLAGLGFGAGQLGRKLREWGVYKYNSKNRPEDYVHTATDDHKGSKPLASISSDENAEDTPVHALSATDTGVPVPPVRQSSRVSGIPSKVLPKDQASAATDELSDFAWCVKSVLKAYADATYFVEGIQEKKESTEATYDSLKQLTLNNLKSSFSRGRTVILTHYEDCLNKFGEVYAQGDLQARWQMQDVRISLRSCLHRTLYKPLKDDSHRIDLGYTALWTASDDIAAKAVHCLKRLYERILRSTILPVQSGDLRNAGEFWQDRPQSSHKSIRDRRQPTSAWGSQADDRISAPNGTFIPESVNDPGNERLSDVDMDRFSAISLTPSSLSGFASMRSLAQRIRRRQAGQSSSGGDVAGDLPSSAMTWSWSSNSLQLFGRLSSRLSVASSQKTGSSQMSWKPEIPTTIQEDNEDPDKGLLARFRRPRTVRVSAPEGGFHVMHVGYDDQSGSFSGLPKEWQRKLSEEMPSQGLPLPERGVGRRKVLEHYEALSDGEKQQNTVPKG